MDRGRLIDLLLEATTMKRMPRSGWIVRGVPHVESVAEHSFGTALVALVLADVLVAEDGIGGDLDLEKVLAIALLHDLAEVRLTDLPLVAVRLLPADVKSQAEAAAVGELLAPLPGGAGLAAWWREFEEGTSLEGRLVRDADKLEMMIQCLRYEQAGSRGLDEFWRAMDRHPWYYALSAQFYTDVRALRPVGAARES